MRIGIAYLLVGLIGLTAIADDAAQLPPIKEPALRDELLSRTKADQEARHAWTKWMSDHGSGHMVVVADLSKEEKAELEKLAARLKEVDMENTKWLRGIVDKQGWPTYAAVGKDGADAAWLLVQHADAEPKFQRRCRDQMAALPKSDVSQTNLAYLTDRVLLAEGKRQRYGTQFTSIDGKWKPHPIEDEANVDKRRADVGLPTIAEYAKVIEEQYGGAKK